MMLTVMKKRDDLTGEEHNRIVAAFRAVDRIIGNGGHQSFIADLTGVSSFVKGKPPKRYFKGNLVLIWDHQNLNESQEAKLASVLRPLAHSGLIGYVEMAIARDARGKPVLRSRIPDKR